MEVPNGNKYITATIMVEFIGIIWYSLAANLNDGNHIVALVMFTMIVCTHTISGGHLNPALTLAVYFDQNKHLSHACWAISIVIA
jgi:glycerol uptake facilitator-like aquaporin